LRCLIQRCNTSRSGAIRTIGGEAAHYLDPAEAQRIGQVVRALRSRSDSLEALGICRLHTRGRRGAEVAGWNIIPRLLEVAQALSSERRSVLFGQLVWRCDGAGRKRLGQALDAWLYSVRPCGDDPRTRQNARYLLEVAEWLPNAFGRFRIPLLLIASGANDIYPTLDRRVRQLAAYTGCDNERAFYRFRYTWISV
jgi:hypothetical protein